MKVLILGASGGVGAHLMEFAAAAGHTVTAVSRGPIEVPAGVRLIVDDVAREGALDEAVRGQDAVLSSLGIRRTRPANPWSPLASPPDFSSRTARLLVEAMRRHGVRRVIAVSASGVGDSALGLNWMMRLLVRWSNVGVAYRDLERMEAVYAGSGLEWCCVRPTGLKDGPATRKVAVSGSFPFNAWISRADVAAWMVDRLADDLSDRRTPTITEARG